MTSWARREMYGFLRRNRLYPDNQNGMAGRSKDADSAIRVPTMAEAIVDRNGNIIIDLR